MAGKVRSDDYMRIRERVLVLANIADPNNELIKKANRGWHNRATAAQLVPLARFTDLERDPERYDIVLHYYPI